LRYSTNVSLARSALAVAAFTLLAFAAAGATTRAVRPPTAAGHANPVRALLTPHIGMRVVQKIKPDAKCKFDACGELYAKTSSDYLEYEWCAGYGTDPCSDLYSGPVQWYADAYTKKNGTYYRQIANYLESASSSGSDGQAFPGIPSTNTSPTTAQR
jgi:hypothetical protein